MTNHNQLAVKDIVWGKVQPHPWWPGKIAQIISQNNTTIYKVSFFADASYSFLKKQHIISFDFFDFDLNSSFPQNFKLQRAIREVNRAINSKKFESISSETENKAIVPSSNCVEDHNEEQADSKLRTDSDSNKQLFESQETNHQTEVNDIMASEITSQNVVHLIECFSSSVKQNIYCYQTRKQAIAYKQKLKNALLEKYLLQNQIQNDKENQIVGSSLTNSQNENLYIRAQPKIKKIKQKKIHLKKSINRDQYEKQIVRRIQKKLFSRFGELQNSKIQAILIYNEITQRNVLNNQTFAKMAIKIMKILRSDEIYSKSEDFIKKLIMTIQDR